MCKKKFAYEYDRIMIPPVFLGVCCCDMSVSMFAFVVHVMFCLVVAFV